MRLVEDRLPAEYTVTGDHDAWPLIAAGLLSRMTTTLRHIFDLQWRGRAVDAGTLLRSLYEHLVHFAWLAADPSAARIEEWRKDDLQSRLTADNDLRQRGEKLYTDEQQAQLKEQIAGLRGEPPLRLVNLAEAADKAWAGKLAAAGHGPSSQMRSFRGLYGVLYRMYSGSAHPTVRGLNPVVEDITATEKRIVLEKSYQDVSGPYGMATVIYALALYVAALSLGWPDPDRIEAAFQRHPG
jgi:Family of unknown function (DUF5677)